MHLLLSVVVALAQVLTAVGVDSPAGGFDWPLAAPHQVVRAFEAPPDPWAAGHRGVDLAGTPGQLVTAAGPGTITFSGVIAGRGVVTVTHPGGRRTTYEPVDDRLPEGTAVSTGTPIGRLPVSGGHCAARVCLHWGLLVGPRDYRDPLSLLRSPPIVLLPVLPP